MPRTKKEDEEVKDETVEETTAPDTEEETDEEAPEATEADLIGEKPKAVAPKAKKVAPKEFDVDETDASDAPGEEATEQAKLPGVPNRVSARTIVKRIAGKDYLLPVNFTARTQAGVVVYGPQGQRLSHPTNVQAEIIALGRKVAHMNKIASANAVAEELKPAPAAR